MLARSALTALFLASAMVGGALMAVLLWAFVGRDRADSRGLPVKSGRAMWSLPLPPWIIRTVKAAVLCGTVGATETFLLVALYRASVALRVSASAGTFIVVAALAYVSQRRRRPFPLRPFLWVIGAAGYVLLVAAAFQRGQYDEVQTAATGAAPWVGTTFGMDVKVVEPIWTSGFRPPNVGSERLVELGSGNGSVYLYDCRSPSTLAVPVVDVELVVPLDEPGSEAAAKLSCLIGPSPIQLPAAPVGVPQSATPTR